MSLDYVIVAVAVAAFAGLVKILEFLLPKKSNLLPEEKQMLVDLQRELHEIKVDVLAIKHESKDLHDWHARTDEEGRPLWYTPRGMHEQNEKMMDVLRELSGSQKDITNAQKDTARILERILIKLDKD